MSLVFHITHDLTSYLFYFLKDQVRLKEAENMCSSPLPRPGRGCGISVQEASKPSSSTCSPEHTTLPYPALTHTAEHIPEYKCLLASYYWSAQISTPRVLGKGAKWPEGPVPTCLLQQLGSIRYLRTCRVWIEQAKFQEGHPWENIYFQMGSGGLGITT